MPKVDILLNPGDDLPKELDAVLKDYFSDSDFEKLRKFGGRIQISITAPFTDRKSQNSNLVIDARFIADLKITPMTANDKLETLTKEQLIRVANLLHFPVSAKATTKEIKNAIVDYLSSEEKWKNISES